MGNTSGPPLTGSKTVSSQSRFALWARRILLGILGIPIFLALFGAIFQTVTTEIDRRSLSSPGMRIDVGGYKIYLNCTGTANAKFPTVVLEAGLGGTSPTWALIQPEIAQVTRVCAYDRAGMGLSDPGPMPRDAQQIVDELHTLLEKANIPGPYILVGHSYGGLYARLFAATYPDQSAGLVLLESAHPDQYIRTAQAEAEYQNLVQMMRLTPIFARVGIMRISPFCLTPDGFPAQPAREVHAFCSASIDWDTQRDEVDGITASMAQVRGAPLRHYLPLAVVSAGQHVHESRSWAEFQSELEALSPYSLHIFVSGATHASLWTKLEDAHASSSAILDLVNSVNAGADTSLSTVMP